MRIPLLIGSALMLMVAVGLAPMAQATVMLDQDYTGPPNNGSGSLSWADNSFQRAQVFTVGISGLLDHVDVLLNTTDPSQAPLVRILETTGGLPNGTVLATSNVVGVTGDGWISYDLSAAGLTVSTGDVLAIEPVGDPAYRPFWAGGTPGSYAGGCGAYRNPELGVPEWTCSDFDFFFRTYVEGQPVQVESSSWGRLKATYR